MRNSFGALLIFASLPLAGTALAQALTMQGVSRETQDRGYWIDPASTLMWAAKDNGKDISWSGAVKYCQYLHLANYSDWRLANMFELQPIYDKVVESPGLAGPGDSHSTWHVKGGLFLTGYQWANTSSNNGHSRGYEYYFDFNDGRSNDDPVGWPYPHSFRRALCVRGSGDPLAGQRQPQPE